MEAFSVAWVLRSVLSRHPEMLWISVDKKCVETHRKIRKSMEQLIELEKIGWGVGWRGEFVSRRWRPATSGQIKYALFLIRVCIVFGGWNMLNWVDNSRVDNSRSFSTIWLQNPSPPAGLSESSSSNACRQDPFPALVTVWPAWQLFCTSKNTRHRQHSLVMRQEAIKGTMTQCVILWCPFSHKCTIPRIKFHPLNTFMFFYNLLSNESMAPEKEFTVSWKVFCSQSLPVQAESDMPGMAVLPGGRFLATASPDEIRGWVWSQICCHFQVDRSSRSIWIR